MELNRIPNSRNDPRLRYEETRRDTQTGASERVQGARQALVRLSELRAAQLRKGRGTSSQAQIEKTRDAQKGSDQIDISDRAKVMAREHDKLFATHKERAREFKIRELKARFEQGGVTSKEGFERAAAAMLGAHKAHNGESNGESNG